MKFRLHWKTGKTEDVQGDNLTEAFTKAGYRAGAVAALDFCEPLADDEQQVEQVTPKGCVGEIDVRTLHYCSACGEKSILQHSNYCSNCGGKVDWSLTEQLEVESPMCDGCCTKCEGCGDYTDLSDLCDDISACLFGHGDDI